MQAPAILVSFVALLMSQAAVAEPFAIVDTTIVDPSRGTVRSNMTVIVDNGHIVSVVPANSAAPRAVRTFDGRGKYLLPGFWDAHSHIGKTGRNSLALFIANGITGVRDMGSNLLETKQWIQQIESGQMPGPRIRTAGPMLEAKSNVERMRREATVEDVDQQRRPVSSPEEGRAAVRDLARQGAHHIKMRTTPNPETFRAVSEEAAAHSLPFAAHPVAPPADLTAAGLDSVEHFLSIPPLDKMSEAERRELFRKMAAAGMRVTATDIVFKGARVPYEQGKRVIANTSSHDDTRRRYICGYIVEDWAEQVEENKDDPYSQIAPMLPAFNSQMREMKEEGVAILAGSDAGVMFVYPGFSMHDQLELMVKDMHFTPMEVLKIATAGVPAYFGEQSQLGSVEPGKAADLVLLDANPVENIAATRRVHAVVSYGRLYDRAALDRMLEQVENDSRGNCAGGSNAGRKPPKPGERG